MKTQSQILTLLPILTIHQANTSDETHADDIENGNAIQNSPCKNENLSSNSSIIPDDNPANGGNAPLIYCFDFSLNGNTIKNSAETLEKIIHTFLFAEHQYSDFRKI